MGRWARLVSWSVVALLGCAEAPASTARASDQRSLTLLHTSDLHSRVWPFRERISSFESSLGLGSAGALEQVGGFARLGFVVERERQQGASLWLDSGDALEGAEVFERFGGRIEIELLGALGLSALGLGNHELSLSSAELAALLATSPFPVLTANLAPASGSSLESRLAQGVLLDVAGVKVGVVGVANPTSPPEVGDANNRWQLVQMGETAAATQAALDDLRPRADVLIALTHLGVDRDHELVRSTTGLGLVLGGHQHVITREPEWQDDCASPEIQRRGCTAHRVPIVHSGAYGKFVSRLELELSRSTEPLGGFQVSGVSLEQLPLSATTPERSDVLDRLEPLLAAPEPPLAFLPASLARRSAVGGDSPLGNLTANAMLAASGADVVVLNSSGLRGDLEPGVLLRSELALAFPFAEPWLLVRVAGRDVRRGLERAARRSAERRCESTLQIAGLRLRIDCAACAGKRGCVSAVRVTPWGELALEDEDLFTLCLPAYLTQPGAEFEGLVGDATVLDGSLLVELRRYLALQPKGDAFALEPCLQALRELSPGRCREAFGEPACPASRERAVSWCRAAPWLQGERDGRIQAIP